MVISQNLLRVTGIQEAGDHNGVRGVVNCRRGTWNFSIEDAVPNSDNNKTSFNGGEVSQR